MCNAWCLDFAQSSLGPRSQQEGGLGRVLEVGSRQVNGGLRPSIEGQATSYLGVDIEAGPGVDRILSVYELSASLGEPPFDWVISTEMLEHCEDWREALVQMVSMLKPGGHLLLTTRTPGFALHGYPNDYWRFTEEDMQRAFAGAGSVVATDLDRTLGWACGVGVLVRREREDLEAWRNELAAIDVAPVDRSLPEGVHRPSLDVEPQVRAELEDLARGLAKYRADATARAYLSRHGFHLAPVGPASAVLSYDELQASFEHLAGTLPKVAELFDAEEQLRLLRTLEPLVNGASASPLEGPWDDPLFGPTDLVVFAGLLQHLQPAKVISAGPASAEALVRSLREENACQLLEAPSLAQVDSEQLNDELSDGDVLLIHTSHVVKGGSDAARVYLELFPGLRHHVYVHVNRVYLPHPYPQPWIEAAGLEWNEHYALAPTLLGNPRWKVLWGTEFMRRQALPDLERLMAGRAPVAGGSLWLEHRPQGHG